MKVVFNVVLSANIGFFFKQAERYYGVLERFFGTPDKSNGDNNASKVGKEMVKMIYIQIVKKIAITRLI